MAVGRVQATARLVPVPALTKIDSGQPEMTGRVTSPGVKRNKQILVPKLQALIITPLVLSWKYNILPKVVTHFNNIRRVLYQNSTQNVYLKKPLLTNARSTSCSSESSCAFTHKVCVEGYAVRTILTRVAGTWIVAYNTNSKIKLLVLMGSEILIKYIFH